MLEPKFHSHSQLILPITSSFTTFLLSQKHSPIFFKHKIPQILSCSRSSTLQIGNLSSDSEKFYPISGLEDEFFGYISGKKKATEVAHLAWKHVIQKGDTVIDATCGNGYDTLAMLKMVVDESGKGWTFRPRL